MSTAPILCLYAFPVNSHASHVLGDQIRANIVRLRNQRGWSRPDLAKRCIPPTSSSQIERLEKGQRGLEIDWVERIARGFNVDPAYLIAGEDQQFNLTPQVADEVAGAMARFVLGGAEPHPEILRNLSLMIQDLSATFSAHPSARSDPEVVRPVVDLLTRQRGPQ